MSELPPDQLALLKQAREANLLKAWAGGRRKLSADELAEIAHLLPPSDAPQAVPEPPAARKTPQFKRKLSEYEATFETKIRQLRRWIAAGVEAGDPCPLDDPPQMAAWWAKHMKHRVPPKIAALAVGTATNVASVSPPAHAGGGAAPAGASMDLGELGQDAGEAVKQARALVEGAYLKLKNAYALGDDNLIRLWHPRWEKTVEALRKQEKDDIASRRILGLVIDRAAVETDILQALGRLKRMRLFMARRVREVITTEYRDLSPAVLDAIAAAIEAERLREDEVFQNLESLKPAESMIDGGAPQDVEFELAS